jgi:hypothetical protein
MTRAIHSRGLEAVRLRRRIIAMSERWRYSREETAAALAGAAIDPHSWASFTEWDEAVTGTGSEPIKGFTVP